MQITVAASLAINMTAASAASFSPANGSFTDWVPKPTASGTSMPIIAMSVAANNSIAKSLFRAFAQAAVRSNERMKTMANTAAHAPGPAQLG